MVTKKGSKRVAGSRKTAGTALTIFDRLSKAGIIKQDITVAELMKQVAAIEANTSGVFKTVVYDTDKYFCIIK